MNPAKPFAYPQGRGDYIDRFFNPGDITERITPPDGAIVTIQRYLTGYSWICHSCRAVGTDGAWNEWTDHMFANLRKQAPSVGTLGIVRHDAKWHAINEHGADENILPKPAR